MLGKHLHHGRLPYIDVNWLMPVYATSRHTSKIKKRLTASCLLDTHNLESLGKTQIYFPTNALIVNN